MKKSYLLLSFSLVALFATLNVTTVKSKITSPPAGSAGDPSTSGVTCAQSGCHAAPTQTPPNGDLTLNIGTGNPTTALSGFVYTPGTVYNIAFSFQGLTSATHPFYGFQIVALNASNAQAGTMTVTSSTTTQVNTGAFTGTRQYMGHKTANSGHNWIFKWTAPAAGTGPVSFYYAYNKCDASSATPTVAQGTIYKGSVTTQEGPTGIADIADKVSELNIFPNPISNQFSMSFDLKEANPVSSQLYSIDGKLVKELINEKIENGHVVSQFDVQDLQSGIYMVRLNIGDASVTKRIVKQ